MAAPGNRGRPSASPVLARAAVAALAAALAAGTLAGCSRAVSVAVPPQAGDPACATPAWPDRVGGHGRVNVSAAVAAVAAWGDPAIVARCGVAPERPTTDPCVSVDGVDWVVRELSDGRSFTTYGRAPAIEVLVPMAYAPEALLLPAFGDAARALPSNGHHCV